MKCYTTVSLSRLDDEQYKDLICFKMVVGDSEGCGRACTIVPSDIICGRGPALFKESRVMWLDKR